MVWLDPTPLQCVSWTLLAPMLLETVLALLILWRIVHQLYWSSHPRRVALHVVLLATCALRVVFWTGLCSSPMLATGLACLWWANSLILLCTAAIIFQWSSAVSAGRVTVQERQRSKRLTVLHPLVLLHAIHLLCSIASGVDVIVWGLNSPQEVEGYADQATAYMLAYRIVNVSTVTIDAVVACYVAFQLRERLLSAAMADNMKRKSVIQMTLLMALLTASLAMQTVMDLPVLIQGVNASWGGLSFASFCLLKYLVPGVFLSLAFLYIMRRVEQREPTRLVVLPSSSLVEFVECSSPDCVWCAHHRRFHVNQNKWDVTLMTSLSPRTVDSSYHSSTHAHVCSQGSQGSWSSASTPELLASASHVARDGHHRLHQAHAHPPLYPHTTQPPQPVQTQERRHPSHHSARRGARFG